MRCVCEGGAFEPRHTKQEWGRGEGWIQLARIISGCYDVCLIFYFAEREKTLNGECSGNFVTEPTGVALSLADIFQYFSHILPHKAVMFINADVTDESILHLDSEIVTLHGTTTECSIIATTVDANEPQNVTKDVYSIPNDLKIKVVAVEDQPADRELFQKTRDLFESFDCLKVKDIRRPFGSSTYSAQLHFYEEVGLGVRQRSNSIELKKPERVYAQLTASSSM